MSGRTGPQASLYRIPSPGQAPHCAEVGLSGVISLTGVVAVALRPSTTSNIPCFRRSPIPLPLRPNSPPLFIAQLWFRRDLPCDRFAIRPPIREVTPSLPGGDAGRPNQRVGRFTFCPPLSPKRRPVAPFSHLQRITSQGHRNAPGGRFRPQLEHAGNILQTADQWRRRPPSTTGRPVS